MLTSAALKLSELVSGPFLLNIPAYQRPYAWGDEQVCQLIDDLLDASGIADTRAGEDGYFLGTFLLMDASGNRTLKIGPKMTPREFDVVDGQQRLATIITLFSVLRDLDKNRKSPHNRRIQSFITAQKPRGLFRADAERFRLQLLSSDQRIFEDFVLTPGSTLLDPERPFLTPSERGLLRARATILAAMRDLSQAQRDRFFEFVSERCNIVVIVSHDIDHAHRMFVVLNERGKKLQRDDIIKADLLRRADPSDEKWIAEAWDRTSTELGDEFEKFFSHIRKIYGHDNPRVVTGVRRIIDDVGGPAPFINDVFLPLAESYRTILSETAPGLPRDIALRLKYLNRLADGDWAPAAMLALKEWQRDPERARFLIAEIDRLAHVMRLSCVGTGKRVRRFTPVVDAIRAGERIDAAHPAFAISREEMRAINFYMKDLHKRGPKICKLLLMRLGDMLSPGYQNFDPELYTIEHILPQRTATTSEWRRLFPTAEERSQCIESLGNLVLVTQKQNDRAKNASFADKKAIYRDAPPESPVLPITAEVLPLERWTRQIIEQREAHLLAMTAEIFRLDLIPSMPSAPPSEPPGSELPKRASNG